MGAMTPTQTKTIPKAPVGAISVTPSVASVAKGKGSGVKKANSYANFLAGYYHVMKTPTIDVPIALDATFLKRSCGSDVFLSRTVITPEGNTVTIIDYLLGINIPSLRYFDTVMKGVSIALSEEESRMKYIGVLWNLSSTETRNIISGLAPKSNSSAPASPATIVSGSPMVSLASRVAAL